MAEATIKAIKAVRPSGPYTIGGHCVGSLIAYEVTQLLMSAGDSVEQLIVLDAPAPHFFQDKKTIPLSNSQWIGVLANTIAHMTGKNINISDEQLKELDDVDQLQLLKEKMAEANMVPENTPNSQIKGLLEVFKANAQLHYPPREQYYPVSIALLRAKEINPHYDYSCYDDDNSSIEKSTLGWHQYAQNDVKIELVSGDHITMLSPENAKMVNFPQAFCINKRPADL